MERRDFLALVPPLVASTALVNRGGKNGLSQTTHYSRFTGSIEMPPGVRRAVVLALEAPSLVGATGVDRVSLHLDRAGSGTDWSSYVSFVARPSTGAKQAEFVGFFSDWQVSQLPYGPVSGDLRFSVLVPTSGAQATLRVTRGSRAAPSIFTANLTKAASNLRTVRLFVTPLTVANQQLGLPRSVRQHWGDPSSPALDFVSPFRRLGIELQVQQLPTRADAVTSGWDLDRLRRVQALATASAGFGIGDVWGFVAAGRGQGLGWMFDNDRRTGLALFLGTFPSLSVSAPTTAAEHEDARGYLYTWVHELGHALGLEHTELTLATPGSQYPSWMNPYEQVQDYWRRFTGGFHPDEALILKHGPYSATIPGAGKTGRFDLSNWGASR